MRLAGLIALYAALAANAMQGQTLQHRSSASPAPAPASDVRQTLPAAAEGEYQWGEPGEVIELYVESGALHGYLTRRSERAKPDSTPMTFAFTEASASGGALSFSTRHIHGDWYTFRGEVVRGPAASPALDGYYLLQGTLATHLGPSGPEDESGSVEPVTRQVALKLTASRHQAE